MALLLALILMASPAEYWDLAKRSRADAGHFSSTILGHRLWDGQLDIKRALRAGHRKVMAPSGHGTGKSYVLADLVLEFLTVPHAYRPDLRAGGSVRVVLMSRTGAQLGDVLWRNVREQYGKSRYPLGGRMLEREGWKINANRAAVLLNADDPEAVQGKHADLQLIIVDEGNKVPVPIWMAINSLMTGDHSYLVTCLNPVVGAGYCYEMAKRRDLWNVITIDGLDHPNVITGREVMPGGITRRWIEELLAEECQHEIGSVPWAEVDRRVREGEYASPQIDSRLRGRFPKSNPDQFIDLQLLEEAAARGTSLASPDVKHIGLDPSWTGQDKSVLSVLDESRTLIHVESWQGQRGAYSAGRVKAAMERFGVKPEHTHIEATGVGASTCDALDEQGIEVDHVQPGGGLKGDWDDLIAGGTPLANRKTELWWAAREALAKGELCIPDRFGEVWADLTAPKVEYNAVGQMRVEPKDKLKKRIGRSPDFGESVITALSRPVPTAPLFTSVEFSL